MNSNIIKRVQQKQLLVKQKDKVLINLIALAIKCRSKKELYTVIMNDWGVLMPIAKMQMMYM